MNNHSKILDNLQSQDNSEINEMKNKTYKFNAGGSTFCVPQRFNFNKVIGQGAYGIVVSAWDKLLNRKVAIKKIPNAFIDLIDAKRILREIIVLEALKHDNVTALIDVLKPEDKNNFNDIYFITELMDTDLQRVIYSNQDLSEDHAKYFMYQIMNGLQYIHSCGIIHRDLKPSNLLVNKNCDLKICDFGMARGFSEDSKLTEYVVTRWYRAPEIILNGFGYTKAIDIWSAGCVMAEILSKAPLFPGKDYLDQIKKILEILGTQTDDNMEFIKNDKAKTFIQKLPKTKAKDLKILIPKLNPQALDLISNMLKFNPDNRYSVEECINHAYFSDIREKDEEIISLKKIDWRWDNFILSKEKLQSMIYEISLKFHPENQ